jgi:hypothetical protein
MRRSGGRVKYGSNMNRSTLRIAAGAIARPDRTFHLCGISID